MLCWGFQPRQLAKLQKKAIRFVTRSKYNAHSEPLFKKLSVLKLDDMLIRKTYNFYYQLHHMLLPQFFSDSFSIVRQHDTHEHNTRTQMVIAPRIFHKFAEQCIRFSLPKLLNENIVSILEKVHTHSQNGFSYYVKNVLLSHYQTECYINNCYICCT